MKRMSLSAFVLGISCIGAATCTAADFKPPVRLTAADAPVRVESPGYAAPCWTDIKGDGKMHLLVGQFMGGKIQVFPHIEGENFGAGTWLQAAGDVAEVPGVW